MSMHAGVRDGGWNVNNIFYITHEYILFINTKCEKLSLEPLPIKIKLGTKIMSIHWGQKAMHLWIYSEALVDSKSIKNSWPRVTKILEVHFLREVGCSNQPKLNYRHSHLVIKAHKSHTERTCHLLDQWRSILAFHNLLNLFHSHKIHEMAITLIVSAKSQWSGTKSLWLSNLLQEARIFLNIILRAKLAMCNALSTLYVQPYNVAAVFSFYRWWTEV